MKKLTFFFLFVMMCAIKGLAQDISFGPDCLGVWCSVDVDLTSPDPAHRYTSYQIPEPPEPVGVANTIRGEVVVVHQSRVNCIGPGRPYLNNELGGDPILNIDLYDLDVDSMGNATEALISFPVQKLSIYGSQCYYYIRLVLHR